jgi:hypothetical protein
MNVSVRAATFGQRNFVNIINRKKNTALNLPHMMAVLGFASFYGVKPSLSQRSFRLHMFGEAEQEGPQSSWVGRSFGGLLIETFSIPVILSFMLCMCD